MLDKSAKTEVLNLTGSQITRMIFSCACPPTIAVSLKIIEACSSLKLGLKLTCPDSVRVTQLGFTTSCKRYQWRLAASPTNGIPETLFRSNTVPPTADTSANKVVVFAKVFTVTNPYEVTPATSPLTSTAKTCAADISVTPGCALKLPEEPSVTQLGTGCPAENFHTPFAEP